MFDLVVLALPCFCSPEAVGVQVSNEDTAELMWEADLSERSEGTQPDVPRLSRLGLVTLSLETNTIAGKSSFFMCGELA